MVCKLLIPDGWGYEVFETIRPEVIRGNRYFAINPLVGTFPTAVTGNINAVGWIRATSVGLGEQQIPGKEITTFGSPFCSTELPERFATIEVTMGNIRPRKITELIAILWKRKAVIILMTAAMLLATILVVKRIPDTYESRGLVIVSAAGADLPVVVSQITATTQQLSSLSEFTSLLRKYPLYPGIKNADEASNVLGKAIKTEVKNRGYYPDGPESFKISYRHSDPKLAQQVVSELIDLFNQSNEVTKKQAGQEIKALNDEIAQLETQLKEYAALAKQVDKPDQGPKTVLNPAAVATQRMTTAAAIETLKDKQFGLEQQIATIKRQINDQQKLVKQTAPPAPAKSDQGALLLRKATLQANLKIYEAQYTDKNPKVIQTRTELEEVNRLLATLSTATTSEVEPSIVASVEAQELRTHQRELARLETELEVTRRDLDRKQQFLATLPVVDPSSYLTKTEAGTEKDSAAGTLSIGAAVYSNQGERNRTLLARREALQKVVNGTGAFQVIDYPTVSQNPVGPNRLLYKLIGLLLGLLSGVAIAFALELPGLTRIQDVRDVDYLLGAPVLALIPETLTPSESIRVQRLHLARGFLVVMLIGGLIPMVYLLLKGVGIFQILGSR